MARFGSISSVKPRILTVLTLTIPARAPFGPLSIGPIKHAYIELSFVYGIYGYYHHSNLY
jgi:hypothetical protein